MAWLILVVSGAMETVWATALGKSEGLRKPTPSIVFVVGCARSTLGLSIAIKSLPVGAAYAVWVGIGAVLTVLYAMAAGSEPVSFVKIVLLLGIVGCVVGLKLAQ